MPPNHQQYVQWNGDRFRKWAAKIGVNTNTVIDAVLSGYKVDEDIKIEFTGLRPGEKLYEELLMDEEGLQNTDNELIHIGKPIEMDESLFFRQLRNLEVASRDESNDIKGLIKEIVPTYNPKEE